MEVKTREESDEAGVEDIAEETGLWLVEVAAAPEVETNDERINDCELVSNGIEEVEA